MMKFNRITVIDVEGEETNFVVEDLNRQYDNWNGYELRLSEDYFTVTHIDGNITLEQRFEREDVEDLILGMLTIPNIPHCPKHGELSGDEWDCEEGKDGRCTKCGSIDITWHYPKGN